MGKNKDKNKNEIPNPMSVTNRDILQRLNFLYQASVLLNGLAPPGSIHRDDDDPVSSTTPNDKGDKGTGTGEGDPPSRHTKSQRKKRRRIVSFEELSRNYVETMKIVGQKTNVKMCVRLCFVASLNCVLFLASLTRRWDYCFIHRPCTGIRL